MAIEDISAKDGNAKNKFRIHSSVHHPRIELEPLAKPVDGKLVFYH